MKNLIPETKRSYFKVTLHIMIFSILISLLLITMNSHEEREREHRKEYMELKQDYINFKYDVMTYRITNDSVNCKQNRDIKNVNK